MLLVVDVIIMAAMLLGAVTSTVESSYNLMVRVCKKIVTHQTPILFIGIVILRFWVHYVLNYRLVIHETDTSLNILIP